MKTVRVYRLHPSHTLFQRLKAAQQEAAHVWNTCCELHKTARQEHAKWPGRNELQRATKGKFALHSQSVQMIVHAFLANVETARQLKPSNSKIKYPWKPKRFYPVMWPAQAVGRERGRVVLPMGKGASPSFCLSICQQNPEPVLWSGRTALSCMCVSRYRKRKTLRVRFTPPSIWVKFILQPSVPILARR